MELKSDYINVIVYKVKKQKSIAFLYTSNEQEEFEIKNIMLYFKKKTTILFTLAFPKMKYLGVYVCVCDTHTHTHTHTHTRSIGGKLQNSDKRN